MAERRGVVKSEGDRNEIQAAKPRQQEIEGRAARVDLEESVKTSDSYGALSSRN